MNARKTLTVTLETVTPLFLGGAEPHPKLKLWENLNAGLRAPRW